MSDHFLQCARHVFSVLVCSFNKQTLDMLLRSNRACLGVEHREERGLCMFVSCVMRGLIIHLDLWDVQCWSLDVFAVAVHSTFLSFE